jgi:nitroreductase
VNRQPWEFFVVGGEVLEKIKQAHIEILKSLAGAQGKSKKKKKSGDIYRKRQVDLAVQLYALMDIGRDDAEKRAEWYERGFRFFDAPAAIILLKDKSLEAMVSSHFDLGSVTQTICLAALEFGLGTCIEGQGKAFPEVLRAHAGIPDAKEIVTTVAIGYPDWDFPANKIITPREEVDSNTTWRGFD